MHSFVVCGGSVQRNCERRKNSASCYSNYDHGSSDITANRDYDHCLADNDSSRDHNCGNRHGVSDHDNLDLCYYGNYNNENRTNYNRRHNGSTHYDNDFGDHDGSCSGRTLSRADKR